MERFNPITDLQPIDPFNSPNTGISDEVESLRLRLEVTKKETKNIIRIIKDKNDLLNSDLKKLKNLNRRLNITIPRIPAMPGEAGVIFGEEAEQERRRKRLRLPRLPLILPSPIGVKSKVKPKVKRPGLQKAASRVKTTLDTASLFVIPFSAANTITSFSRGKSLVPLLGKGIQKGKGGGAVTGGNVSKNISKVQKQFAKTRVGKFLKELSEYKKPINFRPESKSTITKRRGRKLLEKIQKENRLEKKADKIIADLRGKNKKIKTDLDADSLAFKASTDKNVAKKVGEEALIDEIMKTGYQDTLFPTISKIKTTVNPLIKQLRSGNVAKSKLYRTLGLDDKFTRNNFANYLEPANPKFQAKILRELGLIRGTSRKAPVSKDTFRFIMNAFKPSDFMLQQIRSGKMPTGIDPRIKIFNQLKDAGYKIKLKDIVPKKDYNLLEKGLRLEDMPFQKLDKQLELKVPQDISSLNIDTGITNTVIILTDPPIA
jgi:hypothetical protein